MPTTRYLDFDGGNDANNGSTFALRKKTMASANSGLASGDTINIMGSPDPTSLGQNATLTNSSDTVTLTTAVTLNIDTCESAWTASANITATAQATTHQEGTNAASLVVAAGFTTGLVAYHAMSATDFSGYKQISLLIRSSATVAVSTLTLSLCSDTAGVTAVNTIAIPALVANYWTAIVIDTGAALGSAIQSVALNALLDPGSVSVFLDNVIACKDSTAADSLTHHSLIGKNTGIEPWMMVGSINGTTIKLGCGAFGATLATQGNLFPYYYGATATQTLYKREPILLAATLTPVNNLIYECGWDRTAMSSQSGLSFLKMCNPTLVAFNGQTVGGGSLNKLYAVNATSAIYVNTSWKILEIGAIGCLYGLVLYQNASNDWLTNYPRSFIHCKNGIYLSSINNYTRIKIDNIWGLMGPTAVASGSFQHAGVYDGATGGYNCSFLLFGANIQGHYAAFGSTGNTNASIAREAVLSSCVVANCLRDYWYCGTPKVYTINCTLTSLTPSGGSSAEIYETNRGGDTTSHKFLPRQYLQSGFIVSDVSTRHTASDFSWKFDINGSNPYSPTTPLSLPVAKIACVANEQRTVTLWFNRNTATVLMRLRVKGGLISGIDTDVITNMTAAINTWQQVTLQFTPTQQGVVEVFAECYGCPGTTAGLCAYIDDLGVS